MAKGLCSLVAACVLGIPILGHAVGVTIVTNDSWSVTDPDGNPLGNAKPVCLGPTIPANCPATATVYGYPRTGWTAPLTGATWIWAEFTGPGATTPIGGQTTPAAGAEFAFESAFYLCGTPQGGNISLAADDFAEVFLNGSTTPVATSTSHATVTTATVPASALRSGLNMIRVTARNGANPPDCPLGEYRCNPAGLILSASFSDDLGAWPSCTGVGGRTFTVGTTEMLSCPPGRTGAEFRTCLCFGGSGIWGPKSGNCAAPPPTCTGNGGQVFQVNGVETLSCPSGFTGSASRTCGANGWGPVDSSNCSPPPVTCTGTNGASFSVGATEMLACDGAGSTGSRSRTCLADGTWGPTTGNCACGTPAGSMCGNRSQGQTSCCPNGTSCGSRPLPTAPRPWWCPLALWIPSECRPEKLVTTDWFCD
jgi:hypothetical protein